MIAPAPGAHPGGERKPAGFSPRSPLPSPRPRWTQALSPSFRVVLGLLFCLPGGFILALGAFLLWPGAVLVAGGLRRLTEIYGASGRRETWRASMSWPTDPPMRVQ